MKKYIVILILSILVSCAKDKRKDDLVDIKSFLKEGVPIISIKSEERIKELKKINKLELDYLKNINSWSQSEFNSKNLIPISNSNINKKKKSINGNFEKILSYNNHIISINNKSEIFVFDNNLKIKRSIKIYKKKIYKNHKINFELAIYKNKIFVSDNLGNIYCFDFENLEMIWNKSLIVPFKSKLKIYKDQIFIINNNSKIFSIDIYNGKINWSFETASKILKSNASYQLAISNDKVYFTNDLGELYCLDLNKKTILWSLIFESSSFSEAPLIFKASSLIIDGNNLIISSNYGTTYSINANNGNIIWKQNFYTLNKFVISEKYLITINRNKIIILNKTSGEIYYHSSLIHEEKIINDIPKNFMITKDYIYLFYKAGLVVKVNNNNLDDVSVFKTSDKFISYIISQNSLYLLSKNVISLY